MDSARLVRYLRGLSRNNSKEWFEAHRADYDALRADFTDLTTAVINGIKRTDPEIKTVSAKGSQFRINRDLRFSKDKRPYKTQFSASITEGGRASISEPGYYFQINHEGKLFQGGGLYAPDPQALGRIRRYVASFPAKLQAVLDHPRFESSYGEIGGEKLARLPAEFAPTTSMVEYIKLKSFVAGRTVEIERISTEALLNELERGFADIYPLIRWLRYAASD